MMKAPTSASWRKGTSGNPNGRPRREWTWAGELEKAVLEFQTGTRQTFKAIVARRLVKEAAKGNMQAIKELMNRMDGLPQRTDEAVTVSPIQVVFDSALLHGEDKVKTDD